MMDPLKEWRIVSNWPRWCATVALLPGGGATVAGGSPGGGTGDGTGNGAGDGGGDGTGDGTGGIPCSLTPDAVLRAS